MAASLRLRCSLNIPAEALIAPPRTRGRRSAAWNRRHLAGDSVSRSGAPRPMKMGTIASPWRYDKALRGSTASPRLRRPVRKQAPHDLRIAFDGQQQRTSWRVWHAPVLLPIAQSRDWKMERLGKFSLRHTETLSQYLDARNPAHLHQLLRGRPPMNHSITDLGIP
jgi:hypothetical protein